MINLEGEANEKQRFFRDAGKRVQQIKPVNTELVVKIIKGFTTDTQPYEGPEYFKVVAWTDAEDQHGTQVVKSFNGLHWFNNVQKLVIPIDSPADQYLYIEFLRGYSKKDPGTSNGTTVMGRAKIKLPPRSSRREVTSNVDLVGLNSDRCVVFKGRLEFSMKLHRYVNVI
ncbi:unnamed protein product [Thlaspi arvense]|uniref:C2 domain-containing protein n=1 Tax=Thlaspi arvense TaxID=13288 RepID=A0AAU9T929_THLAR|nr:unnamed protein product [Thlaspi arvense]